MRVALRSLRAVQVALVPLLCAALLAPRAAGAGPAPTRAPAQAEDPAARAAELDEHFRMRRWAEAAAGYRQRVEAEPQDARAWFRLGYALHALERYDEALECHEQAAVLPSSFQVAATYNVACARALRGEVERALEWLQRAVDAGFRELDLLDSDPDLNNLRTDPRFRRLRSELVALDASASALPCPQGHARQFDFLVGRWRSHNWTRAADGGWQEAGELLFDTRAVLDGAALVSLAAGRLGQRDVCGVLLRRYDTEQDQWVTVVNWPEAERSAFSALRGRVRHGRAEFFTRFHAGRSGEPSQTRATISDVTGGRLRMDTAVTSDGGRTWETRVVYELERVPEDSTGAEPIGGEPIEAAAGAAAPLAGAPEFRAFDFLLGEWEGERVTASSGTSTPVTVRAEAILRGAALAVETRAADPATGLGSYALLGYEPGRQRWVRYAVELGLPGIVRQEGSLRDDAWILAGQPGPGSGGSGCRLSWLERGPERVVTTCERRAPGDDAWVTCWRQELRRVR